MSKTQEALGNVVPITSRAGIAIPTPLCYRDEPWRAVFDRIKKALASARPIRERPVLFRPMEGQPREYFDEGALERLEHSIAEVGQVQMGLARKVPADADGAIYELLDGERRWRAVSRLKLDEYRALLVEIDDEASPYIVAAIANFNRESHTATEISDAIHRLGTGLKVPIAEIARIFGFSEHYTYQLHGLQNLHAEVRAMLDPRLAKDRVLPTTAAIQISKLHHDLQVNVANRVLGKELSLRALRSEVVRVGEVAGKPVRTREVEPRKQWGSLQNITRVIMEHSRDVRDRLRSPEAARLVAARDPTEVGAMLFQLDETIKFAQEAKTLLQGSLKKS